MDNMHSSVLTERVYELKKTQKRVEFMCHELEQIYSEGIESGLKRGLEQGEQKKAKELAIKLYKKGESLEAISELVEVPVSQLEEWLGLQVV